jgi:hypothetical protein
MTQSFKGDIRVEDVLEIKSANLNNDRYDQPNNAP